MPKRYKNNATLMTPLEKIFFYTLVFYTLKIFSATVSKSSPVRLEPLGKHKPFYNSLSTMTVSWAKKSLLISLLLSKWMFGSR